MAKAGKKAFGSGAQGKGDGAGAMTDGDAATISVNVLSSRDKAVAHGERGRDGKGQLTDQLEDHEGNRLVTTDTEEEPAAQ